MCTEERVHRNLEERMERTVAKHAQKLEYRWNQSIRTREERCRSETKRMELRFEEEMTRMELRWKEKMKNNVYVVITVIIGVVVLFIGILIAFYNHITRL